MGEGRPTARQRPRRPPWLLCAALLAGCQYQARHLAVDLGAASELSLLPTTLAANGFDAATLSVVLRRSDGRAATGVAVTCASDTAGDAFLLGDVPWPTGTPQTVAADGSLTAQLATAVAGARTLTCSAIDAGIAVPLAVLHVTFVAPAGYPSLTLGAPATAAAGASFDVAVTALAGPAEVAARYTGTLLLASTDPGATLPSSVRIVPSGHGTVQARGLRLCALGPVTLSAVDRDVGSVRGSATVQVAAGAAAGFAVAAGPLQAGVAGDVRVTALDACGNRAVGYVGTVQLVASDGVALPQGLTLRFDGAAAGTQVAAGALTLTQVGTATAVTARDGALTGSASGFTVLPGPPATLALALDANTATAGESVHATASWRDAFGNPTPALAADSVTFTSDDPRATQPMTAAIAPGDAQSATVTLPLLTVQTTTVTGRSQAGLTASAQVVVAAGTPYLQLLWDHGGTSVAGTHEAVTIIARDATGQVLTGYTGTVQLTASDPNALRDATAVAFTPAQNGNRRVAPAVAFTTAGTQYLLAQDGNGVRGASVGLPVVAGIATHLVVTGVGSGPGTPLVAGQPTSAVVQAQDNYANVDPNFVAAGLTLTASNGGAGNGSFAFAVADHGVHTVPALVLTRAGTATVRSGGGPAPAQNSGPTVTVTHAAAHHLSFVQQPNATAGCAALTPTPQVAVVDAYENICSDQIATSIAIDDATAPQRLHGTKLQPTAAGVATFAGLSYVYLTSGADVPRTLVAQAGGAGLGGGSSAAFAVTRPPPPAMTSLAIVAGDPAYGGSSSGCTHLTATVASTCQPVSFALTYTDGGGVARPLTLAASSPLGVAAVGPAHLTGNVSFSWDSGRDLPALRGSTALSARATLAGAATPAYGAAASATTTLQNGLAWALGRSAAAAAGSPVLDVASGDFDRDGHADLAFVSTRGTGILLAGGSAGATYYANAAGTAQRLAVADLNRDGWPDVATCVPGTAGNDSVFVQLGRADATLAAATAAYASPQGTCVDVMVADWDGDGAPDLLVPLSQYGGFGLQTALLWAVGIGAAGTASSTGVQALTYFSNLYAGGIAGRLHDDGVAEAVLPSSSGFTYGATLVRRADATSASTGALNLPGFTVAQALAAADINQDGRTELLVLAGGNLVTFAPAGGSPPSWSQLLLRGMRGGSLAIGDVDGDGDADAVTADAAGVYAYAGSGSGGFAASPVATLVANANAGACLGETNGDGRLDVLFGGSDGGAGMARGQLARPCGWELQAPRAVPMLGAGAQLAVGDVDEDGRNDVVAAQATAGSGPGLQLFRGDGAGGLTATGSLGGSHVAYGAPALGDLDGDGHLDLAVPLPDAGQVQVFAGDGSGAFTATSTLPGSRPSAVAVGDVTGDGLADLVVGDANAATVTVYVAPRLTARAAVAAGGAPTRIRIARLDGDAVPDIAVLASGGTSVRLLLGDGTTPTVPLGATALLDFVADNLHAATSSGSAPPADLLAVRGVGPSEPNAAVYALNNGTGIFTAAASLSVPGCSAQAVASGDFDGDALIDAAVVCSGGTGSDGMAVLRNNANGLVTQQAVALCGGPTAVAAGDFTGDGRLDLVAACSDVAALVLLPQGAGTGSGPSFYNARPQTAANVQSALALGGPRDLELVDLDRDGALDLVAAVAGNLELHRGNGSGQVAVAATTLAPSSLRARLLRAADLDGDGAPDLVVSTDAPSAVALVNQAAAGGGSLALASPLTVALGAAGATLATADVRREGRATAWVSLGAHSPSVATLRVDASSGTLQAAAPPSLGSSSLGLAAADLDGDGWPDLVASDPSSGDVAYAYNDGHGNLAAPQATAQVGGLLGVAAGDLDHDGRAELAAVRTDGATLQVAIWRGTTSGVYGNPAVTLDVGVPPATAADAPEPTLRLVDLDRDGWLDLLLPTGRGWGVATLLFQPGSTATLASWGPPRLYIVGGSAHALAVGDLNQDGRPDVAAADDRGGQISLVPGR